MKILIVDDHPVFRRGLKQLFFDTFENVTIDEADNGTRALKKIKNNNYNITLLDISMLGKSGLEVLKEAKELKPDLPILILSAYSEIQYALGAIKLGASGYLQKISVDDELLGAVKKILKGGKHITPVLAEQLACVFANDHLSKPHEKLSPRELQIVNFMAAGMSGKEIGKKLAISCKTVSTYRTRVLEKMDLHNNADIIRYALKNGLIDH